MLRRGRAAMRRIVYTVNNIGREYGIGIRAPKAFPDHLLFRKYDFQGFGLSGFSVPRPVNSAKILTLGISALTLRIYAYGFIL